MRPGGSAVCARTVATALPRVLVMCAAFGKPHLQSPKLTPSRLIRYSLQTECSSSGKPQTQSPESARLRNSVQTL